MSKLVGLVGWRGMVGSVLMDRMAEEKDFDLIEPLFFSTSNAGGKAPAMARSETTLQDAFNIDALKRCDIILTAQGGDYTNAVYPKLRAAGWNGHWIDAASALTLASERLCWSRWRMRSPVCVFQTCSSPCRETVVRMACSCARCMSMISPSFP